VKEGAGIPVARQASLVRATAEYLVERKPTWAPKWYGTVEGFIRLRVVPHFGAERTVATISRAEVERFRAIEVGRPKRDGTPVGDATVNRMMAALAAFGQWCLVEGRSYHTGNPWAKHAPLPEDQLPVPTLEAEQLDLVLAALEDPVGPLPSHGRRKNRAPWRTIVELARETGLRRGELGRIRWDDIRRGALVVVSSKARGRTKSRRMRTIPLSARAVELLAALPRRPDGFVFGRIPDGRRAFARAAKAAGLERTWLHLFRHLFASRLAERGAGRADLREAGGWSSSRMADRYTHARLERLRELVEGDKGHARRTEKETGG
jgi:integrase